MAQRLLLIFTAFLLFGGAVLAQTYEPGLLVRSNGDTLRGEIENGFWVEPPTFIHFRPTPTSPAELFQPRQLRAVLFTGGRYLRYEVLPIDHAARILPSVDNLPRGNRFDVHTDSLLADVLVAGPASLVRVVYNGATHYVLRRPGRPRWS